MKYTTLILILFFTALRGQAQKKVAILGSSTAAGNGASIMDSSWVGKLRLSFNKNTSDGLDTIVQNLAMPGYVTYQSLPTDYPTPTNRPAPDPNRNVTYVLNDASRSDVVIINYPTNDIVYDYTPKEMMDNLRLMFQRLNENGIRCYITTSQPRNTATDAQRIILKQLVDSIQINFRNYAINFWDDLVTNDETYMLRAEVNADGTHPNNYGHRLLFQRVAAKNIFSIGAPLPLTLLNFQVQLQNHFVQVKWKTVQEEPNSFFEVQRSNNAQNFQTVYTRNADGSPEYLWNDNQPLNGKIFYRLKIREPGKISFSNVADVVHNDKQATITNLYVDASNLHLQISSAKKQIVSISIIHFNGAVAQKQTLMLSSASNNFVIPLYNLAAGHYIVNLTTPDGANEVHRFSKMR